MCLARREDRKLDERFNMAIDTFLQVNDIPRASRASIWAADFYRQEKGLSAARVLMITSSKDEDLRAALLLEQGAYAFLNARPKSWPHKYAFHCIMAAHLFQQANKVNF
jgi:hypothetical protein